jgi:hypothetical protein
MFLYQRLPRCSVVLQYFLDHNPEYWCLVPMLWHEAKAEDHATASFSSSSLSEDTYAYITARPQQPESPTFAIKLRVRVRVGESSLQSHPLAQQDEKKRRHILPHNIACTTKTSML